MAAPTLVTRLATFRRDLPNLRRVVVKVGSNVLVGEARTTIDRRVFVDLNASLAELATQGREVILVTSGAVALGRRLLGRAPSAEETLSTKQALAALGQPALMDLYAHELSAYGVLPAQLLMTRDDLNARERFLAARQTLRSLLAFQNVLPIVNENDTLSSEEIRFGDNDHLAALVAHLHEADLLVILSDVVGLCDKDPRHHADALRLPVVSAEDASLEALCTPAQTPGVGTGGMRSKILAARTAAATGVPTLIAPGRQAGVLTRAIAGEDIGTLLLPSSPRLGARKAWLRFASRPAGTVVVDEGARRALLHAGKSLLARGVLSIEGTFPPDSVVAIVGPDHQPLAQGLIAYSAEEARAITGHRSEEISAILGFSRGQALVHRDDLVLLHDTPSSEGISEPS